jgi:hypothetical protein
MMAGQSTLGRASIALALLAVTCRCGPAEEPDPGPPDYDAVIDNCIDACDRWANLGCEQATPTEDGLTCQELCIRVESDGAMSLNPECIASTQVDLDSIDPCGDLDEACAD